MVSVGTIEKSVKKLEKLRRIKGELVNDNQGMDKSQGIKLVRAR